ncbi:uncharacterized protein LAESUDRAFT_636372, partial [Laetiporus sulphureus 93-53]
MHNLFLGLVQYHARTIVGMDMLAADLYDDDINVDIDVEPSGMDDEHHSKILPQVRKIECLLMSVPTAKQLGSNSRGALRFVCCNRGADQSSWGPTRKLKKIVLVNALLDSIHTAPTATSSLATESTVTLILPELLIGNQFVDECVEPTQDEDVSTRRHTSSSVFSRQDLEHLQADIALTSHPTYSKGPPRNIGTTARGKLKADYWKAVIEFELPVSMLKRWCRTCTPTHPGDDVRRELVRSTIYKTHMNSYLSSILRLRPERSLRPNHHNALHLGDFLLCFGPVHGWWMFPFERIIGILQQTATNGKLGQLEKTMLETFCAAANMKAFMKRTHFPDVLQQCASIIETCYQDDDRGTLRTDMRTF